MPVDALYGYFEYGELEYGDVTPVTVTLAQIRQAAAFRLDGLYIKSTATGGDTTALIDTTRLKSTIHSSDEYVGAWILWNMTGANATTTPLQLSNIRGVASYTNSSGTLANDFAWASIPTAGDSYEIHGLLHPAEWTTVINTGLRRCIRKVRNAITVVNGQMQYSLSALTSFQADAMATRVLLREGTVANAYRWTELPPTIWDIYEDDDGYTLNLLSPFTSVASQGLYLETLTPYDTALAADTDTTTCPVDLAVAAAMMTAWERHERQFDERGYTLKSAEQVTGYFRTESARYTPSLSQAVHLEAF